MPDGDGGYYANVADHLRRGHGLVTDLSLMHQGLPSFPHPTPVYPLWPLLLGTCARVLPLETVAIWLPTLLYFLTLLVVYRWGRALYPFELLPKILPGLHAGHLAALIMGINREFFWFSSLPYTEALAYCLLFGGLLRAQRLLPVPGLRGGLELGVWAGAMTLARSQMLLFALALVGSAAITLIAAKGQRRGLWLLLAGVCAAFALTVAPQWIRLASMVEGSTLAAFLRFDSAHASAGLSYLQVMVQTDSAVDFVRDRLGGLRVAFEPQGKYSYSQHFYLFPYALPIALVAFAVGFVGRMWRQWRSAGPGAMGRGLRSAPGWLAAPEHLNWLFIVLLATGSLVSLHLMHKQMWSPWNFHMRHAIVCGIPFFLALVQMLRRPLLAAVGMAILCVSIYQGGRASVELLEQARRDARGHRIEPALVDWIGSEAKKHEDLVVVTRFVQRLWQLTPPNVHYRMYYRQTTLQDLRIMMDELGSDFLVMPVGFRGAFERERPAFRRHFRLVKRHRGFRVFAPIRRVHPG